MSAVEKINRVLDSGVLIPEMIIVPSRGATDAEIQEEQARLCRVLRPEHIAVLRQWNGIALDVIRLFGAGPGAGKIGRLSDLQLPIDFAVQGPVVFGSDAAGFAYIQSYDGRIFSYDSDGRALQLIACDLDDFIDRLVFGRDAASFAGDDWLQELSAAGIVA